MGKFLGVSYSLKELHSLNNLLSAQLPRVNRGSTAPINLGEKTNLNYLEMTVPQTNLLTARQKAFTNYVGNNFSRLVRVYTGSQPPVILPCSQFFCNPPLRAGILSYNQLNGCTGGFLASSNRDGKIYQFTAGHCRGAINYNWLTEFTNATVHTIGPTHNYVFSSAGDIGIVRVLNPSGWNPKPWLTLRNSRGTITREDYPIRQSLDGLVGARVCVTGAAGHATSCGLIQQTNVTITYLHPQVTVRGLFQFSACVAAGDSGAPIFSYGTAYGIVSGGTIPGSGSGCVSFGEPIATAEKLMNVNTLLQAG